ncbi:precorrin-3B C17-methyltransferase [Thermosipho japonicus]|uniref:Precorrin-3B C17-methyltransferase n=1 Tax=Thermosipho japonicus TaxID=90323 RepID=A0A841GQ68_9BACT|nr:precorrin-3B C(17)-methyltransferase [Thermosipho japonicus]MBB6063404.1 precorrin-3B C17-methyltransferase [Thermosipho japonicus]
MIKLVGIGPGNLQYLTLRAKEVLKNCDVVIGYEKYVEQIAELTKSKETYKYKMGQEEERCKRAVELSKEGKDVCLVCGGDPGIYSLSSIILNLTDDVEIIPGISALNACASILGSPLSNDFVVLSFSDYNVDISEIKKRVELACKADFVMVIYNPISRVRLKKSKEIFQVIVDNKPSKTKVALVKNCYRADFSMRIIELSQIFENIDFIDMNTTMIVGNKYTYENFGKLITPRWYK